MKFLFIAAVTFVFFANTLAKDSSSKEDSSDEAQPEPSPNLPGLNINGMKPVPLPVYANRPISWFPSSPWLSFWNHWGTTGGAGPNNEPSFMVNIPKISQEANFQPITENCIPQGQPCSGIELPCCSESYFPRRFCSSYANLCL